MRRLALIFAVALLAAACGGEELSEQIAEQAIGGDADVEISEDGGEVSIDIDSDEGSISIGSGGELPDEITVPVPDGGDVISSLVVGEQAAVGLNYPNDRFDEIVGFYDSWTSGSGETWQTTESTASAGDQTMRSAVWQAEESVKHIIVRDCYSLDSSFEGPFDSTCVDISESPSS